MELEIPKEFYDSIKTVVRYQNKLLLKQISDDYKWDFESLKKKYLKDKPLKELLNKTDNEKPEINKKKIFLKKKKVVVRKEETTTDESESSDYEEEFNKTKCYKYNLNDEIYFINELNNFAYNKEMEFVGILENEGINFDAEEPE